MAMSNPPDFRGASLTRAQPRRYHCGQHVLQQPVKVQQHIRTTGGRLHCHALQTEVLLSLKVAMAAIGLVLAVGVHEATFILCAGPACMDATSDQ